VREGSGRSQAIKTHFRCPACGLGTRTWRLAVLPTLTLSGGSGLPSGALTVYPIGDGDVEVVESGDEPDAGS